MHRLNAIATTAACVVPAVMANAADAKLLSCTIEASRKGALVRLTAYAVSAQDTKVRARLSATRTGPTGLSDSQEAADYDLPAGDRTMVGEVLIDAAETDEVRATLNVESKNSGARCFYPMD